MRPTRLLASMSNDEHTLSGRKVLDLQAIDNNDAEMVDPGFNESLVHEDNLGGDINPGVSDPEFEGFWRPQKLY